MGRAKQYFDGSMPRTAWQPFWEHFQAAVGNKPHLVDADKLTCCVICYAVQALIVFLVASIIIRTNKVVKVCETREQGGKVYEMREQGGKVYNTYQYSDRSSVRINYRQLLRCARKSFQR